MHRISYVTTRQIYLAVKLNLVTGCGYGTSETNEVKKRAERQKKESKEVAGDEETEEEYEDVPFSLVTQVNNILQSMFSNVEVYINDQ